jgi:glutaredoxin
MKNKNKIEVYTLPNCTYCKTVKEHLKENNIEFVEKSTIEFAEDWNIIAYLTGMSSTPTIVKGDDILIPGRDYKSPSNLLAILENRNIPAVDNDRYLMERLKSMNYNMYTAFNRLGDIIRELQEDKNGDS